MKNSNKKNTTYSEVNKVSQKKITRSNSYSFKTKMLLLAVSFIFSLEYGICQQYSLVQKKNIGLAVSGMVGPDGYGILYLPTVYYKKNRNSYFMGPVIQNQKMNVSGAQLNYDYSIVNEGEGYYKRLELFCFVKALYQGNALLGKQTLCVENLANAENAKNASQAHFKSIEFYAGFGFKIKLFDNIKWVSSIGTGGYTSFNSPSRFYYAEYSGHHLGIMFNAGISIDLKK